MRHDEAIERLGGPRQVAEGLGIENPNTVYYWTRRRIPPYRLFDIERMARALGLSDITAEALAMSSPPDPRSTKCRRDRRSTQAVGA